MLNMSSRPGPPPPFTRGFGRQFGVLVWRIEEIRTMARELLVRRVCSVLAMVFVGAGGLGLAPAATAKQDASSAVRRESPASAGDLDPTFGNGGIQTTDFFGSYDVASSLALQADGKIVLAGQSLHGSA